MSLKIVFINPSHFFQDVCVDKDNFFGNTILTNHNANLLTEKNVHLQLSVLNNIKKIKLLHLVFSVIPFSRMVFTWFYDFIINRRCFQEPMSLIKFITGQNPDEILNFMHSNIAEPNVYRMLQNLPNSLKRIKIISGNRDRYNDFAKLLVEHRNDLFHLNEIDGSHHLFHCSDIHLYL